jgi:AcrR family transcriptional regulator
MIQSPATTARGEAGVTADNRDDGRSTKDRLLDSAEELFAAHGLDRVSVRDLAAAAGVNVAAVNYHFQSKENLYRAVLVRRLQFKRDASLAAIGQAPRREDGTPELEPLIRAFVAQYLAETITTTSGRNFVRLIAGEMHGPSASGEVFLRELVMPVQRAFGEALNAAEPRLDRGQIIWIIQSIVGQCIHIVMRYHKRQETGFCADNALVAEFTPDADADPQLYVRQAVDFVTRFSVGGVGALVAVDADDDANAGADADATINGRDRS